MVKVLWARSAAGADRHWALDIRRSAGASLHVLGLFAELFQFGLERDDFARYQAVIGLGTDRIDLAVHFLGQEIERAPDGIVGFQAVVELREMALQPGQLLGDVRAV